MEHTINVLSLIKEKVNRFIDDPNNNSNDKIITKSVVSFSQDIYELSVAMYNDEYGDEIDVKYEIYENDKEELNQIILKITILHMYQIYNKITRLKKQKEVNEQRIELSSRIFDNLALNFIDYADINEVLINGYDEFEILVEITLEETETEKCLRVFKKYAKSIIHLIGYDNIFNVLLKDHFDQNYNPRVDEPTTLVEFIEEKVQQIPRPFIEYETTNAYHHLFRTQKTAATENKMKEYNQQIEETSQTVMNEYIDYIENDFIEQNQKLQFYMVMICKTLQQFQDLERYLNEYNEFGGYMNHQFYPALKLNLIERFVNIIRVKAEDNVGNAFIYFVKMYNGFDKVIKQRAFIELTREDMLEINRSIARVLYSKGIQSAVQLNEIQRVEKGDNIIFRLK